MKRTYYSPGFTGKKHSEHSKEMMSEGHKIAHAKKNRMLPAIPPNDYKGTIAGWMRALIARGILKDDGEDFYGDHWLTEDKYNEILDECEQ